MIETVDGIAQGLGYALRMSFWSIVEGRVGGVMVDEIHGKAAIESLNGREATKQDNGECSCQCSKKKEVSDD